MVDKHDGGYTEEETEPLLPREPEPEPPRVPQAPEPARVIPQVPDLSMDELLLSTRRSQDLGNKALEMMVYEHPDATNDDLINILQGQPKDSAIVDPKRFVDMEDIWDHERTWKGRGFTQEMKTLNMEESKLLFQSLTESEGASSVRANLALSSKGVLINKSWLQEVGLKQLKGFILPGLSMQTFLQMINKANPVAGSFVNIGLSLFDFAGSLGELIDPVGVVLVTVGEIMKEMNVQAQRRVENEAPTEWKGGEKFGYVKTYKNGEQFWTPAILAAVEPTVAFGSRTAKITLQTGDDLIFPMDGEGNVRPVFTNPENHFYNIGDAELTHPLYSSKDYIERGDPTRAFYLLSGDEVSNILGSSMDFEKYQVDSSEMNKFETKLYNWENALDTMREWKMGPVASATHSEFYKSFEPTRKLRDVGIDYTTSVYTRWLGSNSALSGVTDENYLESRGSFLSHPENEYILNDVFFSSLKTLLQFQSELANNSDLKEYNYNKGHWEKAPGDYKELHKLEQTDYSQMFLGADLPQITNSKELSDTLDSFTNNIELSTLEKNFYAAKATTRFWAAQIVADGGYDDLHEFVTTHNMYNKVIRLHKEVERLELESTLTPSSILEHDVYPWSNEGEGIAPADSLSFLTETQQALEDGLAHHAALYEQKFKEQTVDAPVQRELIETKLREASEQPASPEPEIDHVKYRDVKAGEWLKQNGQWMKVSHVATYSRFDGSSYTRIKFDNSQQIDFDKPNSYVPTRANYVELVTSPKGTSIEVHKGEEIHKLSSLLEESDDLKSDILKYLEHEHGIKFDSEADVRPEDVPFMAFDSKDKIALHGDVELEKQLDIPDNREAVRDQKGVVHEVFVPHSQPR